MGKQTSFLGNSPILALRHTHGCVFPDHLLTRHPPCFLTMETALMTPEHPITSAACVVCFVGAGDSW